MLPDDMALELAGEWPARGLNVLVVAGLPAPMQAIEAGSLPYLAKPFRPLHSDGELERLLGATSA
jgi:hypothetical protein